MIAAILEVVFLTLLELIVWGAGYLTGWLVVPLFTFGRVKVDVAESRGMVWPTWPGAKRDEDGQRIISAEAGAFWGIAFWAAVIAMLFLMHAFS